MKSVIHKKLSLVCFLLLSLVIVIPSSSSKFVAQNSNLMYLRTVMPYTDLIWTDATGTNRDTIESLGKMYTKTYTYGSTENKMTSGNYYFIARGGSGGNGGALGGVVMGKFTFDQNSDTISVFLGNSGGTTAGDAVYSGFETSPGFVGGGPSDNSSGTSGAGGAGTIVINADSFTVLDNVIMLAGGGGGNSTGGAGGSNINITSEYITPVSPVNFTNLTGTVYHGFDATGSYCGNGGTEIFNKKYSYFSNSIVQYNQNNTPNLSGGNGGRTDYTSGGGGGGGYAGGDAGGPNGSGGGGSSFIASTAAGTSFILSEYIKIMEIVLANFNETYGFNCTIDQNGVIYSGGDPFTGAFFAVCAEGVSDSGSVDDGSVVETVTDGHYSAETNNLIGGIDKYSIILKYSSYSESNYYKYNSDGDSNAIGTFEGPLNSFQVNNVGEVDSYSEASVVAGEIISRLSAKNILDYNNTGFSDNSSTTNSSSCTYSFSVTPNEDLKEGWYYITEGEGVDSDQYSWHFFYLEASANAPDGEVMLAGNTYNISITTLDQDSSSFYKWFIDGFAYERQKVFE